MKKKYNMKRTISMEMFISEFNEAFTSHMTDRLLEIGKRCVLIRKDMDFCFDLKHVEHIKYAGSNKDGVVEGKLKEYSYGQFLVNEGMLFFSSDHVNGNDIIQYPTIGSIYSGITATEEALTDSVKVKQIVDANIDDLVDRLLEVVPELSPEYLKIIGRYQKK